MFFRITNIAMYTCLIGCFLTLLSIPAAARLAKKSEEDVISIPLTAPQSAASISPSHFSFSIEQDRWLSWAGNGSRNDFVYNALDNIKQLTGEPPWIRIGGDSEDHTIFDSSVQVRSTHFLALEVSIKSPYSSRKAYSQNRLEMSRIQRRQISQLVMGSIRLFLVSLQVLYLFLWMLPRLYYYPHRYSRNLGCTFWKGQHHSSILGNRIYLKGF